MGVKEAVLGEVADQQLRRSALVRRVRQRHVLARWQTRSIDTLVDILRREGLLRAVEEADRDPSVVNSASPWEDPIPLELAPAGRAHLRRWLGEASSPGSFREELLTQIAASEDDDLPELDAMVRARLASLTELAEEMGEPAIAEPRVEMPWHEKRILVARGLDLSVLDGMARGLRRAHAEIVEALEHHERPG